MKTEFELKFYIDSKEDFRNRLQLLGAKQIYPERLMRIRLFDYKNKDEMNATGKYKWFRI